MLFVSFLELETQIYFFWIQIIFEFMINNQ